MRKILFVVLIAATTSAQAGFWADLLSALGAHPQPTPQIINH